MSNWIWDWGRSLFRVRIPASRICLEGLKKKHPQSGWLVSQTGFEPGSSRMKIGIITTWSLLSLWSLIRILILNQRPCNLTYSTRVPPVATVLRSLTYALNISRHWRCHRLRRRGNGKTIMILSLAKLSQGVQTASRFWFLCQSNLASFRIATRRVRVCLLCRRSGLM
jgi:hypothetical protein